MDDFSLGRERGQQDVIGDIREALQIDKEGDAADNLEGALIDLKRTRADKVCINTITRVQGQIAKIYKIIQEYE